ncbi:MAG: hypothetical protein HQL68_02735 [Magnetococcales bacterium]|nr:hypothetical protein [Magnetococcales bacterium]
MKRSFIVESIIVLTLIFSGLAYAADSVEQKPFDSVELEKFIAGYPVMTKWQSPKGYYVGDLSNPWVMAGMQYDSEFALSLKEKGWDVSRYFYLLNHVRQGMIQEHSKRRAQKLDEKINRQMAEMAQRVATQQKMFEAQMQEQNRRAEAWIKDQLAAQKEQVRNNPYMHPLQKKSILEFLNRSSSEAQWVSAPQASYEQAQARANAQQKAWEESYRQSIKNNQDIPVQQKIAILEGLDRANQPVAVTPQTPMPTQKEMMNRMQEQRKEWIEEQIARVQSNPGYSAERKKKIVKRLQRFAKQVENGFDEQISAGLPVTEKALVQENFDRLVKIMKVK